MRPVRPRELAEAIERWGYFNFSRKFVLVRLSIYCEDKTLAHRIARHLGVRKVEVRKDKYGEDQVFLVSMWREKCALACRQVGMLMQCEGHRRLCALIAQLFDLNAGIKGRHERWMKSRIRLGVRHYQEVAERDATYQAILALLDQRRIYKGCPLSVDNSKTPTKVPLDKA